MDNNYKWLKEENMLVKEFMFDDFSSAMGFANKVADISNQINHHPNILIHDYNKVRISITTHEKNDVTKMDFELANLIDHIIGEFYT